MNTTTNMNQGRRIRLPWTQILLECASLGQMQARNLPRMRLKVDIWQILINLSKLGSLLSKKLSLMKISSALKGWKCKKLRLQSTYLQCRIHAQVKLIISGNQ